MNTNPPLDKEKIKAHLDAAGVRYPQIILYSLTDSTNVRATHLAEGSGDDAIIIAEAQTAGKGRRGRSFLSRGGVGIYISFLTHPMAKPEDAVGITAYAAVKLCHAVESLTEERFGIKWVNDLYLKGKKVAGILTEGAFDEHGGLRYAICGIGVNVLENDFGELSEIAGSIEELTGKRLDRNLLTARIISAFLSDFGDFRRDGIIDEYINRSFLVGKNVTVRKVSESYPARVVGIDRDYSLILDRDGEQERLFTGEVSVTESL